ncbi:putative bifunctional diguanylate cyclase/phosphodiesterase [Alkalisalibacterium limincola]|uniref:EAL domain-containing protein n=1 Tax=Alkalisalibacterium limincola TaxID=2699169 RepID=A0A5C8KWZ5_9GAMM|nr:EAL domain-containing protein [Alkalisalibacterium limincola]TXK65750.1 EAL domain-containing protein [Alkalisalibacterium limincola]
MRRGGRQWRLQDRIVAWLVGLIVVLQLLVFIAVDLSVNRAVASQLRQELEVGARIWDRYVSSRGEALVDSAGVLAGDFGFRRAVATGDEPTMRSALANHVLRLGGDLAILHSVRGEWRAATGAAVEELQGSAEIARHVERARMEGRATGVFVLGGRAHQVATVPVMAPDVIGWVSVAQPLDDGALAGFREMTGLDAMIRLAGRDGSQDGSVVASTLAGGPDAAGRSGVDPARIDGFVVLARDVGAGGATGAGPGREAAQLVLLAPTEAALAPYRRLQVWILALSLSGAFLAVVVAVFVAGSVSRPVAAMATAARRVAGGDFSARVTPHGGREVVALGDAFNRMQEALAARESRILHQASHDGLTGLPNRVSAARRLDEEIARAREGRGACSVLMIDLDRFKEINDTLGHAFGDALLLEVARRLRAGVRSGDMVARLGGDEFLAILPGSGLEAARELAVRVSAAIKAPMELSGTQVAIESSIGLAAFPDHADAAEPLLRRADMAMYQAKGEHLPVCTYEPGREESHLRQLKLMSDLRRAQARGQLRLVFQPKLSLPEGRVCHAEALLRWNHHELGPIGPDEFIPLAERSGIINTLSDFVIDGALAACRAWLDAGLDLGVAINLSAIDLLDDKLPDAILGHLRRHRLPPRHLIVEVTESAVMRDIEYAVRVLERLRAAGVRLAIDDFGTGHSSLAQLKRLPVDELKIDKSFVMRLVEGSDDDVIVRSTIEIGHNMGLSVIAEGVETEAGLALLKRYGCDMAQGYLFSPPLESAAFAGWCNRHRDALAQA